MPERRGGERPSGPRRLDEALGRVVDSSSPGTVLADVQSRWSEVVGEVVAARAEPVAERDGRITIACESGTWAQELEMMSELLLQRLAAAVGPDRVRALRFTADLSRHR